MDYDSPDLKIHLFSDFDGLLDGWEVYWNQVGILNPHTNKFDKVNTTPSRPDLIVEIDYASDMHKLTKTVNMTNTNCELMRLLAVIPTINVP